MIAKHILYDAYCKHQSFYESFHFIKRTESEYYAPPPYILEYHTTTFITCMLAINSPLQLPLLIDSNNFTII